MSWRLRKLRCEGVEWSLVSLSTSFVKNILAQLRHRIFHEVEWGSKYILRDINVCFIALVYMDYLIFLQRLKHGGPWLGKLSLSAQRRHL
jgi:hypothetical protein